METVPWSCKPCRRDWGFAAPLSRIASASPSLPALRDLVARLLDRHGWIAWIGLVVILQVALDMIWNGSHEVACQFVPKTICDHGFIATVKNLLGAR